MKSNKLYKILYKKATGFKTKEISAEYSANDGELLLTKKKIVSKDIPPDLNALKLLIENDYDGDYSKLTDEQLKNEVIKYFSYVNDSDTDSDEQ